MHNHIRLPLHRHPYPTQHPPPLVPAEGDPELETSNLPKPDAEEEAQMGSAESSQAYQPSALEVLVVKAMLYKALRLPVEIVDRILDSAEYWPHTSTLVEKPNRPNRFGTRPQEDSFLLRTPPLGFVRVPHRDPDRYTREQVKLLRISAEHPVEKFQEWIGSPVPIVQHPCRKIVFTIRSKDQGWGGNTLDHGTYRGSWTWFEAGLERIDASGECGDHCPDSESSSADKQPSSSSSPSPSPQVSICALRSIRPAVVGEDQSHTHFDFSLAPSPDKVQCNKTAGKEYITHIVEWRATDDIDPESPEAEELEKMGRGPASGNGEFVRNLKLGDVVTLWAKTRFQGWANNVESAKVDVYWSI